MSAGDLIDPVSSACSLAAPELRMSRRKPCRMLRFASPVARIRRRSVLSPTSPKQVHRRAVPHQLELVHPRDLILHRQPQRTVVVQLVVEETELDRLRPCLPPSSARRRAGCRWRGWCRSTTAFVNGESPGWIRRTARIERRVGEPQRQLRRRPGASARLMRPVPDTASRGDAASNSIDRQQCRPARSSARSPGRCPRPRRTNRRCAPSRRSAASRTCRCRTA